MKKNLLTAGFLVFAMGLSAQSVLFHVDAGGIVYVGKNALVYNGGGLQMKTNAVVENHGNVMVSGNGTTDVFKTIDASNAIKLESNGGGNFINKLNEPGNYTLTNSTSASTAPVYTYGQLFISGVSQGNITGIIDQEFRQVSHGAYQQMGFPFYGKSASTLKNELGKTFTTVRRSQNEILRWDNGRVVFDNLPDLNFKFGQDEKPFKYYSVGGLGLDVSTNTKTLKGRPVSDFLDTEKKLILENAGLGVNFGVGTGNVNNQYGGRYNTYVQDGFEIASGGSAWQGDFGRNIYQFGNPYLTNIDLSQIAISETGGDGNYLSNIYGVRLEVSGVTFNPNTGGGSTSYKAITYNALGGVIPTGDVEYQVIRPLGTFVIKLKNNTIKPELNLATLRRFKYHPRSSNGYSVTAGKGSNATATVKQLGIIGLDFNGNEVERSYYVVSPETVSGNSTAVKAQIGAFDGQLFGTYEEDAINGGYDQNHQSYWLYLNEANEIDFKGKNIKLVNYNSKIVGFRFEIRENAELVSDATHLLSQGIGFYYKKDTEAIVQPILQNAVVSTVAGNYDNGVEYNIYYGEPNAVVLNSADGKKSTTIVVYNPQNDNFVVMLDRKWKTAEIKVYDISGKLVHSASKVSSTIRYELPLQANKAGYVVHITSDQGEQVVTKILR